MSILVSYHLPNGIWAQRKYLTIYSMVSSFSHSEARHYRWMVNSILSHIWLGFALSDMNINILSQSNTSQWFVWTVWQYHQVCIMISACAVLRLHCTDCVNLGTHVVTSSFKPASLNPKTASWNMYVPVSPVCRQYEQTVQIRTNRYWRNQSQVCLSVSMFAEETLPPWHKTIYLASKWYEMVSEYSDIANNTLSYWYKAG